MSIAGSVDEAVAYYERLVDSLGMGSYRRQWDMNGCGVGGNCHNK